MTAAIWLAVLIAFLGAQITVVWRIGRRVRAPEEALFHEVIYWGAPASSSTLPPTSIAITPNALHIRSYALLRGPRKLAATPDAEVPLARIRSAMRCKSVIGPFVSLTYINERGATEVANLRIRHVDEFLSILRPPGATARSKKPSTPTA